MALRSKSGKGSSCAAGGPARKSAPAPDRLLRRLREGKDLRREKVQRLRKAIRAGSYENDLKLSIALDRLLREAGME